MSLTFFPDGYKRACFHIIISAVLHKVLDGLPRFRGELYLIKDDDGFPLFQLHSILQLQTHENATEIGDVVKQIPDFGRTRGKIHQYMGIVFVCSKLFGNGGLPDTPRALYQHGCPSFVRPLPLEQVFIDFPFEYHGSDFVRDKDSRSRTNLKMFSRKTYTNLNLLGQNARISKCFRPNTAQISICWPLAFNLGCR